MAFIRQTWTLIEKTLLIVAVRSWLGALIKFLIAPVVFFFFIGYAKNFFVPPSDYGIGSPAALRSFSEALQLAGPRQTVAFVNNGLTGGYISQVINDLSTQVINQGLTVEVLASETDLLSTCRSTIRGVTPCFGAVSFVSSPNEGPYGVWNYTMFSDGALGAQVYVNSGSNDQQVYILPFQHAIDNAIASLNNTRLPDTINQYPFTSETAEERRRDINEMYAGALISILAIAYFVGMVGICYELTGFMARERELGMAQLIEAMMPNQKRWEPQMARLLSNYIGYAALYMLSWIIGGAVIGIQTYPSSNIGISIGFLIMAGLSLASWSLAFATLFKKAQLSGITVTITSIVLAIIVQVVPPTSNAAAAVLSLLFPPMNYTLFIIYMAYFEQQALPAVLSQGPPDTAPWSLPGYVFFIFCAVQIVAYPLIGIAIERWLYGAGRDSRNLTYGTVAASEAAVKVTGLKKYYTGRKLPFMATPETVRAVDDINLEMLNGQITVLLGANGSGKSTTLDMLAGLQRPTSGHITMNATGGIGLCPQKNVLWDELTVYEHVRIFNRLKAPGQVDSRPTLEKLVDKCDLSLKLNAKTSTLSGGQKRKAQLAIMLTGDSNICLLDEVSSGLDPLSRRKIWDILLAERGRRAMLLTTHFLDEADLLADDITILSKGKLAARGSAVVLKHQYGGGYRVQVQGSGRDLPANSRTIPRRLLHGQTIFNLTTSTEAARFVEQLEGAGIYNYQVNGPTIEDVFLKLAAEVDTEIKHSDADSPGWSSDDTLPVKELGHAEKGMQLDNGVILGFWQQTWVLFRKRLTVLRHNPMPHLAALLLPIIGAGLVSLFLKDLSQLTCAPSDNATPSLVTGLDTYLAFNASIPSGPTSSARSQLINSVYPFLTPPPFHDVSSLQDMENYVSANFSSTQPGGFYLDSTPTYAWLADSGMFWSMAIQNLVHISLLNIPIVSNYNAFAIPWPADMGKTLQFVLYFGLIMSAVPGFFSLYPNTERLRNVRALQYSNGIRAGPLWVAYTLFDFLIVLVTSAVTIIIFTTLFSGWYGPGYLFLIFVLFGLSATLMSYVISLFTSSQLATFAFAAGGQCVFFLIYLIVLICLLVFTNATSVDSNILTAHYVIALFFPAGNLLRALLLGFNDFSLICRGDAAPSYLGAWDVYGSCIFYLILQSAVFFTILLWHDSGYTPAFLTRWKKRRTSDVEARDHTETEIYAEEVRVSKSSDALQVRNATKIFGTNTAVDNVSFGVPTGQIFALLGPNGAGKSTTISLVRGDLRPSPGTNSEILIENTSIITDRASARTQLGVCPQFDAIDQVSTIDHLRFYARARGVGEHNVDLVIEAVGLSAFRTRMASKLSGGNKRKLSLAIALLGNPSVLLLDEPSSGMDAASKRVMWKTLQSVSSGRAVLLTTHSMEEADALADRSGIIARRMLALGTSDELRKRYGDTCYVHVVHKDAPRTSAADMTRIKEYIERTFPGAVTEDRVFHGQLRFSVPTSRSSRSESGVNSEKSPEEPQAEHRGVATLFSELESNKEALGLEYYSVSQATLDQVFLGVVSNHNLQEENYGSANGMKKSSWFRRCLASAW